MKITQRLMSGLGLMCFGALLSFPVAAEPWQPIRFVDWCLQSGELPPATQITVDRLLHTAGTVDCQQADEYLSSLTSLDLSRTPPYQSPPITALAPLQGLVNLTELDLSLNDIRDIQPLSSLVHLSSLNLSRNKVTDLSPLTSLTHLTHLNVHANWVVDLSPLPLLTQLTHLDLMGTQATDLTPLQQMSQLIHLSLGYARARDQLLPSPLPARSTVENTHPTIDFSPLRSLTQLTALDILGGGQELGDLSWLEPLTQLQSLSLENGMVTHSNLPRLVEALTDAEHLYRLRISFGSPLPDLSPLQRLPNLTELSLAQRSITTVTPLSTLTRLTVLDLSGNPLNDISSLQVLTHLQRLDLIFTPLHEADCPLTPASICRFHYSD